MAFSRPMLSVWSKGTNFHSNLSTFRGFLGGCDAFYGEMGVHFISGSSIFNVGKSRKICLKYKGTRIRAAELCPIYLLHQNLNVYTRSSRCQWTNLLLGTKYNPLSNLSDYYYTRSTTPEALIFPISRPESDRCHDLTLFRQSSIDTVRQQSLTISGHQYYIYGYPPYVLCPCHPVDSGRIYQSIFNPQNVYIIGQWVPSVSPYNIHANIWNRFGHHSILK